jgi:dCMP deaminase
MPERISRDAYGLKLAEAAALMADCTRRQVGAAIVSPVDHSVIALGYNGLAAGKPGCLTAGACPRGQLSHEEQPPDVNYEATGCRAVHAEVNAILRGRGREGCVGATIYVTDEPCFHCSVVIEGAGIARVVTPESHRIRVAITEPPEWPGPTVTVVPTRLYLEGFREDRYAFLRPEDWDTE